LAAQHPAAPRTVLVVGASLSAEYGLERGQGWVALLAQRIKSEGLNDEVVNASVSGDTTSGGRSRLPALLKAHRPAVVVIELGGNDALRGLPLTGTEQNLVTMTRQARAAGAKVLLLGMQVPPNYGRQYVEDFARVFVNVARNEKAALVPFLLAGVAGAPDPVALFQSTASIQRRSASRMLANVWPAAKPLLR
jgi:acyl-CoA thioesterase-1